MTGQDAFDIYTSFVPGVLATSWTTLSWAERDAWEALADQANSKKAEDIKEAIHYA